MDLDIKEIKGYEGVYFVRSDGTVFCNNNGKMKKVTVYNAKRRPTVILKSGYTSKQYKVHRLVAEAFIPNPNNYTIVRHLNDDPMDNRVDNLAWGTPYENIQDCIRNEHFNPGFGISPVKSKNLLTGEIRHFASISEASRELNCYSSSISSCCCGKLKRVSNYTFAYEYNNFLDVRLPANSGANETNAPCSAIRPARIIAERIKTGEKSYYIGQTSASKGTGISQSLISACLTGRINQIDGYVFRYATLETLDFMM